MAKRFFKNICPDKFDKTVRETCVKKSPFLVYLQTKICEVLADPSIVDTMFLDTFTIKQ